jgi:endoglucanase
MPETLRTYGGLVPKPPPTAGLVLASAGLALALLTGADYRPVQVTTSATNPLTGLHFWVDPNRAPNTESTRLASQGSSGDAALLRKIAGQPSATWLSESTDRVANQIRAVMSASAASATVPIFVAYNLPGRDCGRYSSGGVSSGTAYRRWIDAAAAGIGTGPTVVVIEPDAIPEVVDGCLRATATSSLAMLKYAVTTFARLSATRVYLDAGNSAWVTDPARLVPALRSAGIAQADGFAMNTSNFQTTPDSVHYGRALSAALGTGTHFVVDTSRNGLGPLPAGSGYAGPPWCNPPGRALGYRPTTNTAQSLVDAYLWIKLPGSSDGSCGLGYPPAGTFWTTYALGLAARAAW